MIVGWDPREDAWLAGFTDGEGHFAISLRYANAARTQFYMPTFEILLRADDGVVLETLQRTFHGHVTYGRAYQRGDEGNAKPRVRWSVQGKWQLAGLVAYFDRFPLQAKKARDYAIWRRAVSIYCARGGADRSGELAALRDALMAVRAFDGPDAPDPDEPFEPQMALGID